MTDVMIRAISLAITTAMGRATPAATPAVPLAPPASTVPQARHSWPHAPWPSRQTSPRPSAVTPHPHHRLPRHHALSHSNQRCMRARAGRGEPVCNSGGARYSATCPGLYFNVVGPCTVYDNCVRSPNYPSAYGYSESCTITPTSRAVGQLLSATAFNTESCCDKLIVNGATYSGTVGLNGRDAQPSNTVGPSLVLLGSAPFTWSSDYSVTGAGWEEFIYCSVKSFVQ